MCIRDRSRDGRRAVVRFHADAAHHVVHGGSDLHGLFGDVDVRQLLELVVHAGELLLDVLRVLVADVEPHAAVLGAAAFLDLGVDRLRDQVAKSIYTEVKEGRGTEHGGVWLDISHKDAEYIKKKLPSMYHQFKELADVDITKEPMEIGPTMHYVMSGIRVEPDNSAATIPGLFACGECSGGMHGGNRLGGNSLSDLVVFGKRAGEGAVQFAKANQGSVRVDEAQIKRAEENLLRPFASNAKHTPYDVHFELQDMMSDNVGIMRTGEDIKKAIDSFPAMNEKLRTSRVEGSRMFNPGWHLWADMQNMLLVAEVVAKSALQREESRGAHTRLDFPKTDTGCLLYTSDAADERSS